MVRPAAYDLTLRPHASFRLAIQLPFSGGDLQVYADMWNRARSTKLLDFTIEWIDRAAGRFDIVASPAQTALIKEEGWWDLLIVNSITQTRNYYIKGEVVLDLVVTETDATG
jgi:hypothetical protein